MIDAEGEAPAVPSGLPRPSRSIVRGTTIVVGDDGIDAALRQLRHFVAQLGILAEVKRRQWFLPATQQRAAAASRARQRAWRAARRRASQ